MARRSKLETGLLSFKFLATAAGLWFAYSLWKKRRETADIEREAALAKQAEAARNADASPWASVAKIGVQAVRE